MKAALKYLLLTAIAMVISAPFDVWGEEKAALRINCTFHSPYEVFFFRLVEEIAARNGVVVERNTPPVARSLTNVNDGIGDGDGPRIAGLSAHYPNLIRVDEPFGDFVFGAFARSGDIRVKGWSSLAPLNVAYIHGWKIFEDHVKETKSTARVRTAQQLFQLLDADRADVALMTEMGGYAVIGEMKLEGIRFIKPPLAVMPNYLYLNRRHQKLASRFAETLRKMKRDGTYDRLYREIIASNLKK
jgi:polar amino acid transport system substrate-binding protein